jgi:hypothetical protein
MHHLIAGGSSIRIFRGISRVGAFLAVAVLLCSARPGILTAQTGPRGVSVSYATGWNLVSGPLFTDFAPASPPLYTFQPGDTDYEKVNGSQDTRDGWGYWAYFNSPATVTLLAGNTDPYTVPVFGGQYMMIGNPSGTQPATVSGADFLYTYSPDAGYQPATTLAPGQGAWALALQNALVTVTPAGP